ncbi:hypothetical protein C4K38_2487 [Pseudomonas chlororaphis subsp. piscium]|nr:hypothetical protein C4K38_2487 [Pseudomonas chlororaphis subsp. piscium]
MSPNQRSRFSRQNAVSALAAASQPIAACGSGYRTRCSESSGVSAPFVKTMPVRGNRQKN